MRIAEYQHCGLRIGKRCFQSVPVDIVNPVAVRERTFKHSAPVIYDRIIKNIIDRRKHDYLLRDRRQLADNA